MGSARSQGSVVARLATSRRRVTGTLTLEAGVVHGTFAFSGRWRAGALRIRGTHERWRLFWRALPTGGGELEGTVRLRDGIQTIRGTMALGRDTTGGRRCGDEYFASDVMPRVLEPICAQCHVEGGSAAAAPFRVTAGDPVATALSALREVDAADPAASKILLKPRAELPHGGGRRITAGSAEDRVLLEWVTLVTSPGCEGSGGGGGGGGEATGESLYAENCASCHGADARGADGHVAVRCHRSIFDAVRNGRTGATDTMPPFTNLSDGDIAMIQEYLNGLCPPGAATGADLYDANCARCHGADAAGTAEAPRVRCATRIADAIANGRGSAMPRFTAMPAADRTTLMTYLGELCIDHGRTGEDLYAGNCSGCHAADAHGGRNGLGVRGPGIACTGAGDYQEKVREGDDEMPAFPSLGTGDVTAIVNYVHGHFCSEQ